MRRSIYRDSNISATISHNVFLNFLAAVLVWGNGCGYSTLKKQQDESHPDQSPGNKIVPEQSVGVNQLPSKTPDNFAFRFKYGSHRGNILDTFEGTLMVDMVFSDTTIPFKLSKEQMDTVYTKMVEIDFFNYRNFKTLEELKRSKCRKHFDYKVRADTIVKHIGTISCEGVYKQKTDLLEQLNSLIIRFIQLSKEYKKLPKPRGGYL